MGGRGGGVYEALGAISSLCSDMTRLQDVQAVNVPHRHDGHMLCVPTFTSVSRLRSFNLNEKESSVRPRGP